MTSVSIARPPLNRYALWAIAALVAVGWSLYQAGVFRQELINVGGWPQFWRFVVASVHPDLSPDLMRVTLDATLKTLAYAVCGTFLSVLIGLLGGIVCSDVWWQAVFPLQSPTRSRSIWTATRAVLAVPRAIHELIWGLFFINLWGLDPLTAVLAIAIPFGAITAKVFSELLDETPRQALQALLSSGVAPLTAFLYGLLPQALLNLLSYTFYRFECSLRSAAVLGIIGAGGLGYEILLSLQSLRYEQLWTFFYALFVLNGTLDFASAWLRRRLGCATRLDLNLRSSRMGSTIVQPRSAPEELGGPASQTSREAGANPWNSLLVGVILLSIPGCFWYVQADFSQLWAARTQENLVGIVRASFPPDWQAAASLLSLSSETIAMSVLAIALAALGGTLLSFPAAHTLFLPGGVLNLGGGGQLSQAVAWAVLLLTRAGLLLCRAIPAPIWALVLLFILFPGILPGAIALGLHNLGILGRLKAEVVENLDSRPLEALNAQGVSPALVFLYGVLPLTLPRFLAYTLYRWEVCMRETVIVGLVGAGGLGRVLTEELSSFDYRGLVVTLTGFVVLTFLVDWISAVVRRSLR